MIQQQKLCTMTTLQKVTEKINYVLATKFARTQYINTTDDNGNELTIRIGDHEANPERLGCYDISLFIPSAYVEMEKEDGAFHCATNKKSFKYARNQYELDEFGEPFENYSSIEELLEFHDITE